MELSISLLQHPAHPVVEQFHWKHHVHLQPESPLTPLSLKRRKLQARLAPEKASRCSKQQTFKAVKKGTFQPSSLPKRLLMLWRPRLSVQLDEVLAALASQAAQLAYVL